MEISLHFDAFYIERREHLKQTFAGRNILTKQLTLLEII